MEGEHGGPGVGAPRPEPRPAGRRSGSRATLIVLIASAAALFAAGTSTLSLPSLDDALYARWGVEMARSGGSFTVTRMGEPEFAKPPLQFWLLAMSFGLLGENDAAARLPSLLMACATLLLVFRLGSRLFDERTELTAAALLVVTPYFVERPRAPRRGRGGRTADADRRRGSPLGAAGGLLTNLRIQKILVSAAANW